VTRVEVGRARQRLMKLKTDIKVVVEKSILKIRVCEWIWKGILSEMVELRKGVVRRWDFSVKTWRLLVWEGVDDGKEKKVAGREKPSIYTDLLVWSAGHLTANGAAATKVKALPGANAGSSMPYQDVGNHGYAGQGRERQLMSHTLDCRFANCEKKKNTACCWLLK
jgi:hypothetical protein